MATKMQKGGPTPYSIRMSTEPMTPKEKRQSKRNTNATIRYVKKNGSGLKMNTDKTNKGVYQEGGGKNSPFTNPYANIPMNSKPIPGSTYQPKESSYSMLKARPKMEGPMNKPMTPEGWSSENNIETPRMPILYKKTGGATKMKMQSGGGIKSWSKTNVIGKEKEISEKEAKRVGGRYFGKKSGTIESGNKNGSHTETARPRAGSTRGVTANFKTGGMVNSNSKITAAKKATGRSGGTTKAISKVAVKAASPKGRVGGTSKAPKKALPKAQFGAIVNRPKTSGGKSKAERNLLKKEDPTMGGRIPKVFIGKGKPKAGGLILKNMSKAKMGGMKGKSC